MATSRNHGLDSAALFEIATNTGKTAGLVQAVVAEQSRLSTELSNLSKELDQKHKENLELIGKRHDENQELLESHKDDDRENFKKVFQWQEKVTTWFKVAAYIWTTISGGAFLIYAFSKWVIPFLQQTKGIGE